MIEAEQTLKDIGEIRFSKNYENFIDNKGNRVEFDDPRIVFVEPAARNPYGKRLVVDLYKQNNRTIRISQETDENILQYGKQVCSGRECVVSLEILKNFEETMKLRYIVIL
ncbi:MAG: hypothetical protein ACW98X_25280 [Promethearchaeota archaeon]